MLKRVGGAVDNEIVAVSLLNLALQRTSHVDTPSCVNISNVKSLRIGSNRGIGPHRGMQRLPFYVGYRLLFPSISALVWVYPNEAMTAQDDFLPVRFWV